ncbi:MAG: hypothetical protein A2Z34_06650 [Planctomycetes bacterium RBG_16_59_8]|nr:MAG: hypothetical protein A2Z34_06650 [Planctomycetes bacterium RBG_16_59_8]
MRRKDEIVRLLFQPAFEPHRIASAVQNGVYTRNLPRDTIIDGEGKSPGKEVKISEATRRDARVEL